MSKERTTDGQIGASLLIRVVQDQIMKVIKGKVVSLPSFPDVSPPTVEEDQKLVDQLAQSVKVIGDQLDKDQKFNTEIDGLAHIGDRDIFSKLVKGVFNDGQINWGRIIVLFYAVGKLAVKMVLANLPTVFSEILDSCLNYLRTTLLDWIRVMGGWISSISSLTQFSIDHTSASCFCNIPMPAALSVAFVGGILMGGVMVWKLNKSS